MKIGTRCYERRCYPDMPEEHCSMTCSYEVSKPPAPKTDRSNAFQIHPHPKKLNIHILSILTIQTKC